MIPGLPARILTLNDFEQAPDVEEDGETFKDNSIKKAMELAKWSGLPVMTDDSGIEVKALDNRPGVYSARYAGKGATDEMRMNKLLAEMKEIGANDRSARFKCAIAFAYPGKLIFVVEGKRNGVIADKPSGSNGFGYDPLFYDTEFGKTFAEMEPEQKNMISHRSMALSLFARKFKEIFGD